MIFFKSTRGLKKGDPLSPSLFVIRVDLFSKLMDELLEDNFIFYSVDKGSPLITHLTFMNYTILFSFGDPLSITMMVKTLDTYEQVFANSQLKEINLFSFF